MMDEPNRVDGAFLHAITDPLRLEILLALETDDLTAEQLAGLLDVSASDVLSKIGPLVDVGLVHPGEPSGVFRGDVPGWTPLALDLLRLQDQNGASVARERRHATRALRRRSPGRHHRRRD